MSHTFDVFKIERENSVLWCCAATTFEEAEKVIREFARSSPGPYIILNQRTGEKTIVEPQRAMN